MKNRRSGFTLVEMLAVIAIMSVVLGTVTVTMHTLFRSTQRVRDLVLYRQQIERFTWQLRDDSHQALSAMPGKAGNNNTSATVLELKYAGTRTVQYILAEQHIDRIERHGTQLSHQEHYAITPDLDLGWQLDGDGTSPLVTVQVIAGTGLGRKQAVRSSAIELVTAVNISSPPAAVPLPGGDGS